MASSLEVTPQLSEQVSMLAEIGRTDREIGDILGLTRTQVGYVRRALGIESGISFGYDAVRVGEIMGQPSGWLPKLMRMGLMRGREYRIGAKTYTQITDENLWRGLEDSRTWHLWSIEEITDIDLRTWARKLGKTHYLTSRQAAAKFVITQGTVCDWCMQGKMPGARRDGHRWYIPEDTVQTFVIPSEREPWERNKNAWTPSDTVKLTGEIERLAREFDTTPMAIGYRIKAIADRTWGKSGAGAGVKPKGRNPLEVMHAGL